MKGKQFFSNKIYLGKSQEERVTGDTKILLAIGPHTRARSQMNERSTHVVFDSNRKWPMEQFKIKRIYILQYA